ncbi:MAG: hypothetical protein J1F60_02045 [Oscillospiraceae bacterium]|nr:hypothetical protein [Oscillospiraceae bacterium]
MKIYITDFNREVDVCIYGVDGDEHTEDFMLKYFGDKGLQFLSAEEKAKYDTAADYAIDNICYEALAQSIDKIQSAIDAIANDYEKSGCDISEIYTFDGKCYVI